ncbi:MAG: hypothetical protein ACLQUT_02420 [Thermoleophilia bacterium]
MRGLSFDELYPGAYLKAGELKGRPVTLKIKSVTREMLSNGAGGEEGAAIVAFEKTEKQFVMNKTNGTCLRAMFGDDTGEWIGKKITLHAVPDASGLSESGMCLRIKGSPQLTKPLTFAAHLGRKIVKQTLVPTGGASETPPVASPEAADGAADDSDYDDAHDDLPDAIDADEAEFKELGVGAEDLPPEPSTTQQNRMLGAQVNDLENIHHVDEATWRTWMEEETGKTSRALLTKDEASRVIAIFKEQITGMMRAKQEAS